MLTDSEKLWLERREFIHQCEGDYIWAGYWEEGIELEVMQEAALFEARVAAKLANIHFGTENCAYCSNHINVNEYCGECKTASTDKRCLACRLKYARLKVEEEIDVD